MERQRKTDEFEIVLLNPEGGGEKKTTYLVDDKGERFNLKSLKKSVKRVIKERKDELKKILAFGGGLTGDPAEAMGFVVAWVTKSILASYEEKNETKLDIVLEEEELDKDSVKEYAIDELKGILKVLEDDPDAQVNKLPTNPQDDFDGTEIFR